MAKEKYVGINNVARKITTGYIGINNVARKIVKGYVGINNVAQQFWQSSSYTPLNYIESSGTQYINTGITPQYSTSYPSNGTQYEIKLANTNTTISSYLFGSRAGFSSNWLVLTYPVESNNTGFLFGYANERTQTNVRSSDTKTFKITATRVAYIDNTSYRTFSSVTYSNNYPLYIFAGNNAGNLMQPAWAKLYYCKIWNNGSLVRDFIPVLDSNNVACLFDKVSETFFYNSGTGDFLYG